MKKNRLEAFSDGVMAIIITIMVLELKIPHGNDWDSLIPLAPKFISYILSFVYIGIYWNNHHHLLHTISNVSGGILWANMHLLFWLSLVPFVTGWMGENHFESMPVALYGFVLLMASIAYYILQLQIVKRHGKDSLLAKAIGSDLKGKSSIVLYLLSIFGAMYSPISAGIIYGVVALMWLIPDQRIEKVMSNSGE
ncbi:MAG TPA: TMEM175 family protein [Bacteroidia bacterium]|nr:TMEM175 family protein [Bacteroidia bacterium]